MNKIQTFQYLTIAQENINSAIVHLQTIGKAKGDLSEESNYYAACLRELLSCDNNEAGLDTVVNSLKRELQQCR